MDKFRRAGTDATTAGTKNFPGAKNQVRLPSLKFYKRFNKTAVRRYTCLASGQFQRFTGGLF